MITLGSSTLSSVRFTDFMPGLPPIPAMNRWATFSRPLMGTKNRLLFCAHQVSLIASRAQLYCLRESKTSFVEGLADNHAIDPAIARGL
jgi:hypothetical protein